MINVKETESGLLQRAAAGNRQAFSKLYTNCINDLYQYVYIFTKSKETSEEIIQDIFVKLWEEREKLINIKSFRNYLFRMAKNRIIDYIRKQQLSYRVIKKMEAESIASYAEADHNLLFNDYYNIARQAVNQLPAKRKLIFRLSTEEYLSLDEIAVKLGISKSVVKKQLYAATAFVKQYLQKHAELVMLAIIIFSVW